MLRRRCREAGVAEKQALQRSRRCREGGGGGGETLLPEQCAKTWSYNCKGFFFSFQS